MAQIFGTQERVYYLGDSISAQPPNYAWFRGATGFQNTVQAMLTSPCTPSVCAPAVAATAVVCAPGAGAVVNPATGGNISRIRAFGEGNLSGQNIAGIDANRAACVAFVPTVVFIEAGTNNTGGVNVQTDATALIDHLLAEIPGVKLWWINVMARGSEKNPDPNAGTVDAINAGIAAAIATRSSSIDLIDIRTAEQAYEAANNTPSPGVDSGLLTLDGTHLNAFGQLWYGGFVQSQVTFS